MSYKPLRQSEGAGEALEQQANKSLRCSCLPCIPEARREDAASLLCQAGGKYAIHKEFDRAGLAYERAAKLYKGLKDKPEAGSAMAKAARAYRNCEPVHARTVDAFEQAAELMDDSGVLPEAAKLYGELGVVLEKEEDKEGAISAYTHAAEILSRDGKETSADEKRLIMADLNASLLRFSEAIALYEQVAKRAVESKNLRWGVNGYLFSASTCQLCIAVKEAVRNGGSEERVGGVNVELDRYCDMHPAFQNSREEAFLRRCTAVLSSGSLSNNMTSQLSNCIDDFTRVGPLQPTLVVMFRFLQTEVRNCASAGLE